MFILKMIRIHTNFQLKVTTPEEKEEAKRKAAEKAKERKAAKKREHELAQEQLSLMVGGLGLGGGGSPAGAAKERAVKKAKAKAAASAVAAQEEGDEGDEGGDEEGDQMSDGENDDDNQAEIYILKKKCDQQVLIIEAHEHAVQGLQQQLDFMMGQNHAYQQRQAAITAENEMLKAKITELEREIEVLDQLNDMTTQSATQENEQLKQEISQLKQEYGVMNQLDDLTTDSAYALGSAGEESANESNNDEL